MDRAKLIRLFLGLIEAREQGAIVDCLWMHGSNEAVWEALIDAIGLDEHAEAITEDMMDGSDQVLKSVLTHELAIEEMKK